MLIRIIVLWMVGMSAVHADKITVRADMWCPFNCDPQANQPGFMIEIAKRIFEKEGHTLDYQILNWARAIVQTREGHYNAIVGAAKSDAPDFIFPEKELGWAGDCFYTTKNFQWQYNGLRSLTQISLGVINDYSYGEEIDRYVEKNRTSNSNKVQVVSGNTALQQNVAKLLKNRIQVLIETKPVMEHFLQKDGSIHLVREAGCLPIADDDKVYIAFSPKHPKSKIYARLLSEGIDALRHSGDLKTILASYGTQDWLLQQPVVKDK